MRRRDWKTMRPLQLILEICLPSI
ncbi:rCG48630 [Rattus norvegicus]|uniref:RCG48630 n=1 Tax=Rattus norvegicus TaxID=10116 RepID=A6HZB1_RAT|nr:rCG48630 [Rattus norvegicus]